MTAEINPWEIFFLSFDLSARAASQTVTFRASRCLDHLLIPKSLSLLHMRLINIQEKVQVAFEFTSLSWDVGSILYHLASLLSICFGISDIGLGKVSNRND